MNREIDKASYKQVCLETDKNSNKEFKRKLIRKVIGKSIGKLIRTVRKS